MSTASPPYRTLAEFLIRVGNIPPDPIRFDPAPGTATIQDVAEILAREGRACELVNGVLLEKPAGYRESTLAGFLLTVLNSPGGRVKRGIDGRFSRVTVVGIGDVLRCGDPCGTRVKGRKCRKERSRN